MQTWSPQHPERNDSDILAYSEYLREWAGGNRKSKYLCDTLYGFFDKFLSDEILDGRTRASWIEAHKKRFAILKPGTYQLVWRPDYCDDYQESGSIHITHECVIDNGASIYVERPSGVKVPWGCENRYIAVDSEYSELEIQGLGLPMFSQEEHSDKLSKEDLEYGCEYVEDPK